MRRYRLELGVRGFDVRGLWALGLKTGSLTLCCDDVSWRGGG
jgi:hypothetical protein